ncbi:MAG: NADH-ubiquinone oxidoreductase-F iron-sulfur binding region domain-containing protein [Patescibacteria group bacterium]|jgi:NADH:ubiquinone oxidoreductase subunit F (NADH-binding)
MSVDIIQQLHDAKLTGRGGASFPTGKKWEIVQQVQSAKKYIVCNVSEGEPGVFKDVYLLEHYPEQILNGIKLALEAINNSTAYLYLRKDLFDKYKTKLTALIGQAPIKLFREVGGYLAGEETAVCASISGELPEARLKPPYPFQVGIFGQPTLIDNLETFYAVAQIASNQFKHTRFYSISGDVHNPGVYELSETATMETILRTTDNFPAAKFFAQIGGGASGEIKLANEFTQPVGGAGAIIVHQYAKTDLYTLMNRWINFFFATNCDKCTPCREGVYHLRNMIINKTLTVEQLEPILQALEVSSFCGFGRGVAVPFRSLVSKIGLPK